MAKKFSLKTSSCLGSEKEQSQMLGNRAVADKRYPEATATRLRVKFIHYIFDPCNCGVPCPDFCPYCSKVTPSWEQEKAYVHIGDLVSFIYSNERA